MRALFVADTFQALLQYSDSVSAQTAKQVSLSLTYINTINKIGL